MPETLQRPYCTVLAVQQEIGNNDPDLVDQITLSINAASRAIDRMCRRDFWFHDHEDEAFKVPKRLICGSVILLPFEIITLTELVEDEDVIPEDEYDFDEGSKLLSKTGGEFPLDVRVYVKGTFGFEVTDNESPPALIYPEVSRACVLIASAWSQEWRKEKIDLAGQRESLLDTKIPSEVGTLLRPFVIDVGSVF